MKGIPIADDRSDICYRPYNTQVRESYTSDAIQFCLTAFGLILVSPLLVLIVILIKFTSPGPVFYRGLRVGKARRVFTIYKFRTLHVGAEEKIGARLLNEQDSFYTKMGRFLKRTKLDELPQLINVLKGEMNLVGPRPIRPIFLENLANKIPLYNLRFDVKPGMTGLAQIKGGYFTDPKDKLRYELIYIKNRTILLDLKLIFLTVFKLLNRWFTLGLFCFILFLFISFIHESVFPSIYMQMFGIRFNLLHIIITLGGGWLLAKRIPKGKLYIYHTSINIPMLAFFLFTTTTSYFALQPSFAFRGSLYQAVTGFIIVFLLINGDTTHRFVRKSVWTIAVIAVFVAFLGLFEVFLLHHSATALAETPSIHANLKVPRISSTLGSPVILSTYLVLGFPLLLCELIHAERKSVRDLWLISATIVFISIILTQSRLGLLSLAVTGSIFFYKTSKRQFISFILGFGMLFFMLFSVGGPRYSLSKIWLEWREAAGASLVYVAERPVERLLIGVGATGAQEIRSAELSIMRGVQGNERLLPSNMHLALIIENGLVGWGLMMWILIATLETLYGAYNEIRDPRLKMIVWAIFASITGFAVSMNSLEPFFNISIQILFWGLLGIGMAIVVRFSSKKPGFIRVWKFGE